MQQDSGSRSPASDARPAPVAQAEPAADNPFGVSYPEAVEQKDALSARLSTYLTAEQKKAFTATATKGGAWEASKNSCFHLAELYYRKLRNDRYDRCIADLAVEVTLSGVDFGKRVNQRKKLVETLATCTRSLKEGDLWFCRSMNRHTAAFVQLHLNQRGIDPDRTIMGHAFLRQPGKNGGTGTFQLLTLTQLREFTAASLIADGLKAFAPPQDEWVVHRSLFTPQSKPKSEPTPGNIGPYHKPYPKDFKAKVELSNELFQELKPGSVKLKTAYMAAQQQMWSSAPGGSLRLAELFASQLTGVGLGSNLVMFMGHHGPQLASVWNDQETCVELLTSGEAAVAPGDFWFYEKPATHTVAFVKVVHADGHIDPNKTIMGHGLVRDMSIAGGTGKFQLLTLTQLRECMSARIKTYSPRSEWVVHRLRFPPGS